jgi:hypothetical protein
MSVMRCAAIAHKQGLNFTQMVRGLARTADCYFVILGLVVVGVWAFPEPQPVETQAARF